MILLLAGLLEIGWAVGLKYTAGFTKLMPSALTLAAMAGSMWLLAEAVRTLPLGTAYAVWTGIGTLGAFVLGITLFNEPASTLRIGSAIAVMLGIAGLKFAS